jgi:hypothetical protein
MAARVYKNKLTLDGRLKLVPGVSAAKVKAVKDLTERHLAGDRIASATLLEVMTTSDAMFNMAHLATLNFVPNFDEAARKWQQIATVRAVPDFKPPTLFSINKSWTDGDGESNVLGAHGEAPEVPEGSAYPYAYISGQVNAGAGIKKRGFKTDWTLEARINDSLGVIDALPEEMRAVALDTEEADVFGALIAQTPVGSQLAGGTVPTGATVPVNAAFSRDALIRAIIELSLRQVNGRVIQITGGYNLLVPVGQSIYVNFILNQTLAAFESNGTPNLLYQIAGGYNPLANVTPIETEWLTGTQWMLMPAKGATRRPVLDRLELRGYQTPQLFVKNDGGNYVGGAAVSPFEGSFDADVITLKLRQFGGAVVWDNGAAIVKSSGAGV